MDELESLRTCLKDILELTTTIPVQFPTGAKGVTREHKDNVLEAAKKIDTCVGKAQTSCKDIEAILNKKASEVHSIVKDVLHKPALKTSINQRISYRDAAANKVTIPKNKLIIKCDDINVFDKKLKEKVSLSKNKINVTFYKKITDRIAIINSATKEDSKKLHDEIKRNIPDCEVIEQKQRNPTILVFRTKNISKEEVTEYIKDVTDQEPILVTQITTDRASRTYIQLHPEQYKKVVNLGKLRIKWESLSFVDAINPRRCSKCQKFGHPEKHCKSSNIYINFVKQCNDLKICSNCACHKIRNSPDKDNLENKLTNLSLINKYAAEIDHVESSKNCPVYVRAYENLKSSIDFGSP